MDIVVVVLKNLMLWLNKIKHIKKCRMCTGH